MDMKDYEIWIIDLVDRAAVSERRLAEHAAAPDDLEYMARGRVLNRAAAGIILFPRLHQPHKYTQTLSEKALELANQCVIQNKIINTYGCASWHKSQLGIDTTADGWIGAVHRALDFCDAIQDSPVLDSGERSRIEQQLIEAEMESLVRSVVRHAGLGDRAFTNQIIDIICDNPDSRRAIERACRRCGELYVGPAEASEIVHDALTRHLHATDQPIDRAAVLDELSSGPELREMIDTRLRAHDPSFFTLAVMRRFDDAAPYDSDFDAACSVLDSVLGLEDGAVRDAYDSDVRPYNTMLAWLSGLE